MPEHPQAWLHKTTSHQGPGEKSCPADILLRKAERRDTEPGSAPSTAEAAVAFTDCPGKGRNEELEGNSWTQHTLSPSLTDTQPARLLLPSCSFLWPQMSRPCVLPAMP